MTHIGINRIVCIHSPRVFEIPRSRLSLRPFPRTVVRFAKEDEKTSTKRKFITREEEPDQYWMSEGERQGRNPLTDPLAIIGLIAIFAPFVILGIAAILGYVDLTP